MVRRACKDDLRGILNLYRHLLPEGDYSDIKSFSREWDEILLKGGTEYFVAFKDNRMVATCNITVISNLTHDRRPFALIENVVSHPEVRGEGFARKVVEMALDHARDQNCYKVILLSASHRKDAHEFYEKLGFSSKTKTGFHMVLP